MSLPGRSFLPGPVELHPDVLAAMARPMIGHRTPEGHALAGRLQHGLQQLLGTTAPVLLATASATAMMEAAVRSGVRSRLLALVGGAFGERFARIAEECGREVVRVHVHPGTPFDPDELAQVLDGPPVDAVSMVHVETATGVAERIPELLATVARLGDVVTIVDAVASIGGMDVPLATWNADAVIGATQKAIGAPPGLAFAVASERFLERAAGQEDRGIYLDVLALHRAAAASRFPFTPALPVACALDTQLARIAAEGMPARRARHDAMRQLVDAWAAAEDVAIVAPPSHRAATVTAMLVPEGRSAAAVVRSLHDDGWHVAPGVDDAADRVVRVGHMGDALPAQLEPLLGAILRRMR